MPAPIGTNPNLARFLNELEGAVLTLKNPKGPTALFPMLSTNLTVANALSYINCQVFATDLNMTAFSNGAHWLRSDTGAVII